MTYMINIDSNCSNNNNPTNKKNIPFSKLCKYCSKPIVWNNDKKQYEDKDRDEWIKHKCKTVEGVQQTKLLLSSSTEFNTTNQLLLDKSITDLLNKNIEFANRHCKCFQFELVIKEVRKNSMHNVSALNQKENAAE